MFDKPKFTVRASSWPPMFDCAYRWAGTYIENLPNFVGLRAVMGTALHKSTATFDQGRLDNSGLTADDTAGIIIDTLHDPGDNYKPGNSDPTLREAESKCLALHGMYCTDWSPKFDWEYVELTTKSMEIDCGNVIIVLTGTLDRSRVVRDAGDGKRGIYDIKSGGTAVVSGKVPVSKHIAQVGTYEMLAENETGEEFSGTGGILGLKTKGKPEISEGHIVGAKHRMIGTKDYPGLIDYAAQMLETGLFPPNTSSYICSPHYCARWKECPYHE